MATVDTLPMYAQPPTHIEAMSAEDFETASIRSAAPSYISDAPSYHTTVSNGTSESIPAYSPRTAPQYTPRSSYTTPAHQRTQSFPSLVPSASESSVQTIGLPPVPSGPRTRAGSDSLPSLGQFRIPSWSNINANPNARQLQNVANRRMAAARSENYAAEGMRRLVLERIEEEERNRFRPLEDPHLVGEHAAARARNERLARENGDDILIREDRRWDFFLAQISDWEERERGWKRFRREVEQRTSTRGRLARTFTSRMR